MKKIITAVAAAACMTFGSANAALVDFAQEAVDNGERAVASGSNLTINGVSLRLFGNANNSPYFDGPLGDRPGGLGVCTVVDMAGECSPASDDNIGSNEAVGIWFYSDDTFTTRGTFNITNLVFRDFEHLLIDHNNDGLVQIITVDEFGNQFGNMVALFSEFMAAVAMGAEMFQGIAGIGFVFVDTEFYVSAIDVSEVPIPAALPLLLSGLAGLGFASRRRKSA